MGTSLIVGLKLRFAALQQLEASGLCFMAESARLDLHSLMARCLNKLKFSAIACVKKYFDGS